MRLGSLGLPELLIILLVVLLIFGPRRLPDMAKGLGQSVREFRKGVKDMKDDFESEAGSDRGGKAGTSRASAESAARAAEDEPARAAPAGQGAAPEAGGAGTGSKEG